MAIMEIYVWCLCAWCIEVPLLNVNVLIYCFLSPGESTELSQDVIVGRLNEGRRVDYVLQVRKMSQKGGSGEME